MTKRNLSWECLSSVVLVSERWRSLFTTTLTWSMTQPNEYMSHLKVSTGWWSSLGGKSSGARHRSAPPTVEDQYGVPSNSALIYESPKSIKHASFASLIKTLPCLRFSIIEDFRRKVGFSHTYPSQIPVNDVQFMHCKNISQVCKSAQHVVDPQWCIPAAISESCKSH